VPGLGAQTAAAPPVTGVSRRGEFETYQTHCNGSRRRTPVGGDGSPNRKRRCHSHSLTA